MCRPSNPTPRRPSWPARLCLIGLLGHVAAGLRVTVWAAQPDAQPAVVLTNLAAIRNLTPTQAELGPPVEVTGVVTWVDAGSGGCFVEDGTTSIWVDGVLPAGIRPGSILTGAGKARPGFFTTSVGLTNLTLLGTNVLPAPRPALGREQLAGKWDGIRLVVSGTLFQRLNSVGQSELRVVTDGVAVGLSGPGDPPALPPLPRRVTVTGVSSLGVFERRVVDCSLLLTSWDALQFESQETEPPEAVAVGSILGGTKAAWLDRPVRLSGTVTWRGRGGFVVEDASGGILVRSTNADLPGLLTKVTVLGTASRTPNRLEFSSLDVVPGEAAKVPPPVELKDDAGLHDPAYVGRRVSLTGRLVQRHGTLSEEEWVLARPAQPESFRVLLPAERAGGRLDAIRFDSTLAVTGVLQRDFNRPANVPDTYLLVAAEDDIRLRDLPPLSRRWTRALLGTTFSLLGVSLVGAVWWWHSSRMSRLRQAQLESENRLKSRFALIAETASDQIVTLDGNGRITSINPAGRGLLAGSDGEPVGREYQQWISPTSRPTWVNAVAQAAAGKEVPPFELLIDGPGGAKFEVEVLLRRLNDAELQCIGRDLTERRRAAELAAENEHWQRLHIEQTPLGVVRFDEHGFIRDWNPSAERIFGWSPGEIVGSSWEVLVPVEHRSGVSRDVFHRVQSNPAVVRNVNLNVTRRGEVIECEWFNNPLLDRHGRFIGVTALVSDVTATRRVQRELADREQQLRTIVESMAEGIIVIDRRRVVISLNPAAEHILGVGRPAMLGQPLAPDWQCRLPDGTKLEPEQHPLNRTLRTGEPVDDFQFSFVARDGPRRWISVNSRALSRGPDGAVEQVIATFTDITARRQAEQQQQQLEEQLRRSETLRGLGTLAGGVAHDFNNLLASMLGNAELIQLELPPGHPAAANAREIFTVAQRGADLVRRILSFSRPQPASRVRVRLSSVVDDSIRMMSKALPAGVRLHCHFEAGEPMLNGDPTQLSQVVINLCTNAAHAMEPQGGDLEVRVEPLELAPEFAAANLPLKPGPAVRLSVRDTGVGMDSATCSRIFEPFFTTKGPGRGTGLGLAIVNSIVQGHGGKVFVESAVGKGTRVSVVVPVDPEPGVPSDVSLQSGEVPRGDGEELLAVDDDLSVLRVVERSLVGLGYRVTAVASPAVALAHLRHEPQRFRLLLTDLTMPEQSGVDLALAVREFRPDLPVIIATGYGQSAAEQLARAGNRFPMLSKPFQLPELAALVRAELRRPPNVNPG